MRTVARPCASGLFIAIEISLLVFCVLRLRAHEAVIRERYIPKDILPLR